VPLDLGEGMVTAKERKLIHNLNRSAQGNAAGRSKAKHNVELSGGEYDHRT